MNDREETWEHIGEVVVRVIDQVAAEYERQGRESEPPTPPRPSNDNSKPGKDAA